MTIHFVNFDFMADILLDNKTAAEAASKIRLLKEKLNANGFSFGELFPVMLTDNGGEFSCVQAFENFDLSIQVQQLFQKFFNDLSRRTETQTFSWTVIDKFNNLGKLIAGNIFK